MKSHRVIVFHINLFFCLITVLMTLILASITVTAQDKHSQQNLHPGIPYSISDIENINLTNGNLMLNFGFGDVKGRGTASMGISLKYNSKLYESHVMTTLDVSGNESPQSFLRQDYEGGWQYSEDYQLRVINRNDDQDQPIQPGGGFVFLPPEQGDGCAYLPPNYKAVYIWKLMMYFPDGSQHEFRPTGYSDESQDQNFGTFQTRDGYFNVDPNGTITDLSWGTTGPGGACSGIPYGVSVITSQNPAPQMTYYSTDGTYMRLEIPTGQGVNPTRWTLFMPDGSKVTNGELDGQGNQLSQRLYDKNANFVTKGGAILPDGSTAPAYVDQFGRYVARKTVSPLEDHIIKLGVEGEPVVWKVKWKYITVIKKYTTSGTSGGTGRCCYSDQVLTSQPKVVDEIELPSQMGGLKYTFEYDGHEGEVDWNQSVETPNSSPGWGDLTEIALPSGAKTQYQHATDGNVPWEFTDQWLPQLGKIKAKQIIYVTSYDGVAQLNTDTWTYSINQSGSAAVAGPDGAVSTQYFYNTTTDNDLSGRVFKEISANGTITERIWANNKVGGCPQYGCGSMRRLNTYIKTEFVTIPDSSGNPSLTTIKDFEYDKNGSVTKVTVYDWISYSSIPRDTYGNPGIPGNILPARVTENVFYNQTETATNSTANNTASYWNITAPNVRNAVRSTEIKNSAGAPVSRAEFEYDNYSTTANLLTTKSWDSFKGGTTRAYSNPLTSTNSITTSATYNSYGMPLTTTDANNVTTQITYGDVTCPGGTVTDLYPTLTEIAEGTTVERTSSAVYDCYTGLTTSTTDEDNDVTNSVEYDALGRPTKAITADGDATWESWTITEYHDADRFVVVKSDLETKDDRKKVATQFYDQLGRVRLSKTLEDASTQSATNETDGIKVQTRYATTYSSPNGYTYQLTSNPFRAATSSAASSEPTMGWTRSKTHHLGRHSEVETFAGSALPAPWGSNTSSTGVVQTDIDANATTVTDQAGKLRRSITNGLGQLIRVDEPNSSNQLGSVSSPNQATHYSYETLGKLVHVEQGDQHRYFMYSTLGRMIRVKQPEQTVNTGLNTTGNPDNNSWTAGFSYDNNGNVLTATDAKGTTTTSTYDALNRATQRSYNDSPQTPTVTFTYDEFDHSKGKLTKVSSSISESRYTQFDLLGRLKQYQQYTDGQTYTSSYDYNLSGALIKETYPSGRVVQNSLDADGQISRIYGKANSSATERTYANTFSYTADGRIEKLRLGNMLWEAAKLNNRLQVTEFSLGHGVSAGDVWKNSYEYGELQTNGTVDGTKNSGNIGRQTVTFSGLANPFIQSYTYDPLYRLTEVKETSNGTQTWKQTFGYDRYGNRTSYDKWLGTTSQSLSTVEEPAIDNTTNRISSSGYTFDANGNLIVDADGRQFTFNGDNKQTKVQDDEDVTLGEYYFDGEGKRIKKVVGSDTTIFVYSGSNLIAEYSTETPPSNPTTNWTVTDQLGSPRVIVNALGTVVSRRDFMPFGEEIDPDGTYRTTGQKYGQADSVRQRFTGYQKDEETGLDFAEARMYQNLHARFTAIDPLLSSGKSANPQSFNRYVYAVNSPLILSDPSGMQAGVALEPAPKCKSGCWGNSDGKGLMTANNPLASIESERYQPSPVEAMVSGFNESLEDAKSGALKAVPNTLIDLWNTGTDMAFNSGGGLPYMGPTLRGNPAAIERIPIYSETEARVSFGLEFGILFAPSAAAAPFSASSITISSSGVNRVFWSGGSIAKDAAADFATANNMQSLEMTVPGRLMDRISPSLPRSVSTPIWRKLSSNFAEGTTGEAHLVTSGAEPSPSSFWTTVERPILDRNQIPIFPHVVNPR